MYQTDLLPSPNIECAGRQIHFLLPDGERITVVAIEGSERKVRLGVLAPETVKICKGKLDLPS